MRNCLIRICYVLCAEAIFIASSDLHAAQDPYRLTWRSDGFINRRDVVNGLVIDSNDRVVVGGKTEEIFSVSDRLLESALIARYDSLGGREWISYAYASSGLDHVLGIAIDSNDNVIIGGETYRYTSGAEAFVVKFSQTGTRLWERHIGSSGNEFGRDVAVDRFDNIYLVGTTTGDLGVGSNDTGYDPFVVKYSTSGSILWTMQLTETFGDRTESISIDKQNNFYLAGSESYQQFISKFDANRNLLWNISPNYSSNPFYPSDINDIVVDAAGNVFAVGETNVMQGGTANVTYDGVVAKHDPAGNLIWKYVLGGTELTSIQTANLDEKGNIYIVGWTIPDLASAYTGGVDSFWAKISPAGNLLWYHEMGIAESDSANGIAIDSHGTVYISGTISRDFSDIFQGDVDMFLARFDAIPEPTSLSLFVCLVTSVGWRKRPNRQC